jgi:hypothetical protein
MIRSVLTILLIGQLFADAFVFPLYQSCPQVKATSIVSLEAADGKKKKRRRRNPPAGAAATQSAAIEVQLAKETPPPEPMSKPAVKGEDFVFVSGEADAMVESPSPEENKLDKNIIADVASFQFEPDDAITKGTF